MPVDPRRVKDLFGAAAAIADPKERDAFLDSECRDEPEVRARLEVLLRAHDNPESALERPLVVSNPDANNGPSFQVRESVGIGAVIAGRYKLLERIGEGGMGEVWVADQQEPIKRRVALKMIKPGMDSRSIIARFEQERQALAVMNHPNIAKVLDAGTTEDGRPFFVMELVKGTPITAFCDERKLSPRERLKLFVPVCQAIQHAHSKGLLHRDIKPSNVLVALHDDVPVPKVIDFGVAKAMGEQLTEKTIYTGFGALIGTPAYMAPEQATFNNLDIDTRADVYALGVLLYELLAGSPPFEPERLKQAALDEMLRLVREEEPPRPSQRLSTSQAKATIAATRQSDPDKLAKLIRGELDWIVMKSLEKDRGRRYETAAGLAKDVERYLNDEPVEACPPTLGYRLRKVYRKNKIAVITTLAVLAGALVAAAGQTWNLLRARAAEADAVAAWNAEAEQREETAKQRDAAITAQKLAEQRRAETNDALEKLKQAQEQQLDDQYVWDMQLLPLAFEANNVAEVTRLLDRHIPQLGQRDRRGFEWHYWDRRLNTDMRTSRLPDVGTGRGIWVASPDGARVALFTTPLPEDGPPNDAPVLTVWDVAAKKVVLTHRMPIKKPVNQSYTHFFPNAPLFSPDGKRVVVEWGFLAVGALGMQRLRQVLEISTGKELLHLDGDLGGGIAARGEFEAAFSADGRRFAAVCRTLLKTDQPKFPPRQVRVWDVDSGKEVCGPIEADFLATAPFTPDAGLLVAWKSLNNGSRVSVWNLADGTEKIGWHIQDRGISALALSPDGKLAAAALAWRAPMGKDPTPPVEPQMGRVWSLETEKELTSLTFGGFAGTGTRFARAFFSPDGSRLAIERSSSINGQPMGDLTVWNTSNWKTLPPPSGIDIGNTSGRIYVRGPNFSPDGKLIVSTDGNVLRTWDAETGKAVLTLRGHHTPIGARAFTPDGKGLWSLETNGLLKEWNVQPPGEVTVRFIGARDTSGLSGLAVSADGSRVASLDAKTEKTEPGSFAVSVWDASGKSVAVLAPPPRAETQRPPRGGGVFDGLALSRDGTRVVLARTGGDSEFGKDDPSAPPSDITVWDVDTKQLLLQQKLEGRHPPFVAISPDGRTVAVTTRERLGGLPTIRLFDVNERRERAPIKTDLHGLYGICFSPDGRKLAGLCVKMDGSVGKSATRLGVWNTETNSRLCEVEAEADGPVTVNLLASRIAWAPDGSKFVLAHGREDAVVLAVYDAATGKRLRPLDQPLVAEPWLFHTPHLAYSNDGTRIAAVLPSRALGIAPALKIWDANTGKELLTARPTINGNASGAKRLTFTGDGHRLMFTELVNDLPPPGTVKSPPPLTRVLLMTTWDATPVPERERRKP